MTQPIDLDAIEQRASVARPGPWTVHDDLDGDNYPGHRWTVQNPDDVPDDWQIAISIGDRFDAAFLAAARTDVPALVDAVRQRDDEIALLRSVAQSAAVLLRSIDANANCGRPQDITAIRAAARALDDTAAMKAQPTVADLRIAAVTAVGVAVITAPTPVLDPSVAYQLQIIDECRPAIANLERALNMRGWRQDDIGTSMLRQLDLDRQAVHIAEERLLDLYGMQRRTAA